MPDTTNRDQLAYLLKEAGDSESAMWFSLTFWRFIAAKAFTAGWRPPPRVITNVDELSALPEKSLVLEPSGKARQRFAGRWYVDGSHCTSSWLIKRYSSVVVAWTPGDTSE